MDILVTFSSGLLHVVEMKMLKGNDIPGPAQLGKYMRDRDREEGWLVFFDARKPKRRKQTVPSAITKTYGIIRTVVIDINPIPPHLLSDT